MGKKANVVIRTEEAFEDDVPDSKIETAVKGVWEERFASVGFDRPFEVEVESIEQD